MPSCVTGITALGGTRLIQTGVDCMITPISTPVASKTHGRLLAPSSSMNVARVRA